MFTTIIPTYERVNLLQRAVRSALDQTCRDVRVIVYDNASGDETESFVREIAARDARVTYHRHPRNIGGAANMAFAMERVVTPFFSILCDDDVLLPRFYEIALREFARFPSAMFVGASTLEISEGGEIIFAPAAYWDRVGLFDPADGLERIVGGKHPTMTSVAFRKELVDAIGTIDPDAGPLLDLDYYIRASARYPYAITRDVAGLFVRHANTWSKTTTSLDRDYTRLAERAADVPRLAERLRAQRNLRLFYEAITTLGGGDRERALRAAKALSSHGAATHAGLVVALATLERLGPAVPWAIRQLHNARFRALRRECLARLGRLGEPGAANGFREELAYFKMLGASAWLPTPTAPPARAKG